MVGPLIARSILAHARAAHGDLVIELGAGTGEIGQHLARLPVRYVGLDASAEMLRLFREKAVDGTPSLVVADCNQPWPLPERSATVVFASRVIHLLDPEHVARETVRIARSGGYLMLGRVLREPHSIKQRLRRRRLELLAEAGTIARQGEEGTRRVIELCRAAGAESRGRNRFLEWAPPPSIWGCAWTSSMSCGAGPWLSLAIFSDRRHSANATPSTSSAWRSQQQSK
jgi:SAM-dependent methyltransferase